MTNLTNQRCVPCESDIAPMAEDEISEMMSEVPDWDVVKIDGVNHLKSTFKFKNFVEALAFTNKVGDLAEEQGHHPVIEFTWGRATVEWWTHNIKGLHNNDFVMAARTSELYQELVG